MQIHDCVYFPLINPLNPDSALLVTSYCAMHRKDCLCGVLLSRNGGGGGSEWSHLQGDMHMVAVVAGCI